MKLKDQILNRFTPLLFVLLLLFVTGCKDDSSSSSSYCTQNPGSCNTVMAAKQFFCFKIGSWWVYEEETTHVRDSVYVFEYSNDSIGYDFYNGRRSALTGYEFHNWPKWVSTSPGCGSLYEPVSGPCLLVKGDKGKFQDFISENSVFAMQYRVGDSIYSANNSYPNNRFRVEDIESSYSLGSNVFGETIKIFELHNPQEQNNSTNFYYSKGVGLVRKEILDSNQVWNLVNYHIEP